ncbi:hypothetical protein VNO77_36351 [Canavalia gladiata]|uniref:Uncharacterized protein n=1 Tax=Canavalia gladiata TaxID=3824 RepID=A0AAN9PXP6_CANGL
MSHLTKCKSLRITLRCKCQANAISFGSLSSPLPKLKEISVRDEGIKLIPKIIYAEPRFRLDDLEDAFDVTIKLVLQSVEKVRWELRDEVDSSLNGVEELMWKYICSLSGTGNEHRWDNLSIRRQTSNNPFVFDELRQKEREREQGNCVQLEVNIYVVRMSGTRHVKCGGQMACTSTSHVIQSTLLELPRPNRHARISSKTHRVSATSDHRPEGPYCIYVGPLETANKETLEALYCQARDAYYSGQPLIVDDMFDRVELRLRWYGSKSVVKYPRCSIRRQSTYADAEEDLSMVFALASAWAMFLAFGSLVCVGPMSYTVGMAYQNAFDSGLFHSSQTSGLGFLALVNNIIFIVLGFVIGYPVASASVKVLQGLWRNDLVALKGACPNCGEEVFAFVRMDRNVDLPHRADCHVCECLLEFRTKMEQSVSRLGRQWVYGRIYLVSLRGRSRCQ